MHILHVFDHSIPLHSGYTFRSMNILREQRKLGWRTAHVTSPKHNLARAEAAWRACREEQVDDLRFYRTPTGDGPVSRLPVLGQWDVMRRLERRLEAVARAERPDIIQAFSPALNARAAVRVGKRLGIPVAYEIRAFWEDAAVSHGTTSEGSLRYRLGRWLESRAVAEVDAVTCICDGLRGDLIARGIDPAKIGLVPNAVNIDQFDPVGPRDQQLAAQLELADKPVIGFIGSYYAYEGLDLLLQAVPDIVAAMPEVQVVLVGGGPMEDSLKAQARSLGVEERVRFVGRVPHEQVNRYYSLIDVLVYPRKSARITELVTPLKPLEAMAQQCLFVASDVGGHKELVRDGETGVLFKADSVSSLVSNLLGMFANRAHWPRLREAGRRFVEQERNWTRSVSNYQPIYQRLLQGRGARGDQA